MPIYAYRCENCGHAQDVLQKISDPVLTVCPVCGKESYKKQVTAAGFQLKGSGWYVTDFRNNSSGAAPATGAAPSTSNGEASTASESKPSSTESATPSSSKSDTTPAKSDGGSAAA